MKNMFCFAAGMAMLLAAAASAAAGAEESRAMAIIEQLLDNFAPALPESGFEIDRNYTLLQHDNAYTAYFPKAAWLMASTRIEFGPLRFRIQPRAEGLSSVSFSVGDLFTVRKDSKVLARLLIGEQDNQGVWDDALQNFAILTGRLGAINVVAIEAPISLSLDQVSFTQALNRSGAATWSQRQTLEAGDLTLQLRDATLSIKRIVGQCGVDGQDYPKWLTLRQALSSSATAQRPDDSQAMQRFVTAIDALYDAVSRFDASLVATELSLSAAHNALLTSKRTSIGVNFKENSEQGSTLGVQFEAADLHSQWANLPAALSPTAARLAMDLVNIPPKLLSQILKITLASEQLAEENQEDYLDQAFAALFLNSNLELYLNDSYIAAPAARLEMSAHSRISSKAALGGSGELSLRIEGLDEILQNASTLIQQQQAGPLLAMLLAFSNRTQSGAKVIDNFTLKLSEDGTVWLNGKDITPLFTPAEADSG